mmetsp:Transcript_29095/g.81747  ORF Transcript_29095/g.81747 Transcript_29095/m.81747 type:complete len:204 (-) Transcript_29095:883-1494(-)
MSLGKGRFSGWVWSSIRTNASTVKPSSSTSLLTASSCGTTVLFCMTSCAQLRPCNNFNSNTPKEKTSKQNAGNPKLGAPLTRTSGGAQSKRIFFSGSPCQAHRIAGFGFLSWAGSAEIIKPRSITFTWHRGPRPNKKMLQPRKSRWITLNRSMYTRALLHWRTTARCSKVSNGGPCSTICWSNLPSINSMTTYGLTASGGSKL